MSKISFKKLIFLIFEIAVITIIAYILIVSSFSFDKVTNQPSAVLLTEATTTTPFPIAETRAIEPFTYLNLSARAVIVYDLKDDKIIFSQQKDDILPIASIAKLMTVYTASKILSPDSVIIINQDDLNLDSSSGLVLGERWDFKNLVAFTLISSSNGGANAIAREAEEQSQINFVSQMNDSAKQIGLQNTSFRNPTGLDMENDQVSGSNSTAQDIAYLYSYVLKSNPELLTNTNKAYLSILSLDNIKHGAINTNDIINQIPNLISSKTGTTLLAGGNLAILFNPIENHPVAVVILGGTSSGRFTDMGKLIKETVRVLGN